MKVGLKGVRYWIKFFVFVAIYWIVVSLVPLNNKVILSGFPANSTIDVPHYFPYPLTLTFLELVSSVVGLLVISLLKYFFWDRRRYPHEDISWIGGPRLLHKLRYVAPVGVLFGLKLGLTNYGLKLVPAGIHLLLQSSSLFWTMVFSFICIKERPTLLELIALLGTIAGTIMVTMDLGNSFNFDTKNSKGALIFAIVVNLSTTVLEGACITALRYGTQKLSHKSKPLPPMEHEEDNLKHSINHSNELPDTNINIDSFEFTFIKLVISALLNLPFVLIFEYFDVSNQYGGKSFVTSLQQADPVIIALIFTTGGVLTLIFQTNITALTVIAGSITVGVIGDLKLLPQIFASYLAFHVGFKWDWLHIAGMIVCLVSVAAYGLLHFIRKPSQREVDVFL